MSKSNANRNKGHSAERHYAALFREMGFSHCVTSRFGSRQHDNAKIDLINIPINVQIKAGKQKGLSVAKELWLMEKCIKETFPEGALELARPNVLIHKKEVLVKKLGLREEDELVYMTYCTYNKLCNGKDRLFNLKKTNRTNLPPEYSKIVFITFNEFKKLIPLYNENN